MSSPPFEFTVHDEIMWWIDLHGRTSAGVLTVHRIPYLFLRTIWHIGDEDHFVTTFILN